MMTLFVIVISWMAAGQIMPEVAYPEHMGRAQAYEFRTKESCEKALVSAKKQVEKDADEVNAKAGDKVIVVTNVRCVEIKPENQVSK